MFLSNHANQLQPMVVAYYDESLDQDVLRVIKTIRRRYGHHSVQETKASKVRSATPSRKNERKREQQIQSLPKYNVEVQTDSPFHKERPLVPSINITRKFPRKGFRDEFDYVDYEYNDENQLPPKKPTMLKVRNQHHWNEPDNERAASEKIARRPNAIKIPLAIDTFIAAQVKDPDSPTRHIQEIESRTMATYSDDASSVTSSPSVFRDVISPISVQPYSFVCSTNMGKNFVTPPKASKQSATAHRILASFTEGTDNETVDLSIHDDVETINSASLWERIVARIMGTIVPITDDDVDVDDTVLLTARAKYEEFFNESATPISLIPSKQNQAIANDLDRKYAKLVSRGQLPPQTRSTLLNDFLDHMLGPSNKDFDYNDDSIAGESFIEDLHRTTTPYQHEKSAPAISRPLLKSADPRLPAKNGEGLKMKSKTSTTSPPIPAQKSETSAPRSRSSLHDIVDRIVGRLSSNASEVLTRQESRRHDISDDEDDDSDEDDDDDDDDDSFDDDEDDVTNFITEISIPYTTSLGLSSASVSTDDSDDSIDSTILSIGRHQRYKKNNNHHWKKSILRMTLLDSYDEEDETDNGTTRYSEESTRFSHEATSFTFE